MTDAPLHLRPDEIELWIDGRLPAHRTSHLETCPLCTSEAEQIRELINQLAALPRIAPSAALADRVMSRLAGRAAGLHLAAEELDLWTTGALAGDREQHLRNCPECRAAADAERVLVRQLETLPRLVPPAGFAERVMDRVDLPVTSLAGALRLWQRRVASNPVAVAIASSVAVVLGGSVAASAAWAAGNQDVILGIGHWLRSAGQAWSWQALVMAQSFLDQQAWYPALRDAMTPGRLVAMGLTLAGLYAGGLVALRRLTALPEAGVARTAP